MMRSSSFLNSVQMDRPSAYQTALTDQPDGSALVSGRVCPVLDTTILPPSRGATHLGALVAGESVRRQEVYPTSPDAVKI